jgi:3-hydroxybutyrate dehydrogenase
MPTSDPSPPHAGRVALVSGAASGIGEAIAKRLAADGIAVIAADLRASPYGHSVECDLTTREGNRAAVDAALERHGRLDIVVANAGFQHVAPIAEFPEDRWDAIIALLLTSPFLLARYAWESLCAATDGRFVAIASAHGLVASPYKSAYVAAKHGVVGLVKTLALEGAPDGVLASAVCPPFVRTALVEAQIADQARVHGIAPERVLEEILLEPHAIKRLVEPEEVAGVVAFLIGAEGRAFTGAAVSMDLGWTAR